MIGRNRGPLALVLVLLFYLVAATDGLTRLPIAHGDEMWNAAPAYKLAMSGVYGSDLFTGFSDAEYRTYQFMPMLQLVLAAVFRIVGLGFWQMRLTSVLAGAIVLLLTYAAGRQIGGRRTGVLAAAVLVLFPIGILRLPDTGIVFTDVVRTMRYHVFVPVFVLAALVSFHRAEARQSRWHYLLAGALTALAYLSHIYGAFLLPALLLVIAARRGPRALVSRETGVLLAGFALMCLPWIIYVLRGLDAYRGQMRMYADRFDVLNPAFYWANLTGEYRRYAMLAGDGFFAWNPGGWIAAVTFPWALVVAARRGVRDRNTPLFAALVVLLTFVVLYAALLRWKTFTYLVTPLPLAVIIMTAGWTWIWERTPRALSRALILLLLIVAVADGGRRIVLRHQLAAHTTPYMQVARAIARQIPPGARVLAAHRFWLGLEDHQVRTWVLPLLISGCDDCDRPRALTAALEHINADVFIVDDLEFGPYFEEIRDPRHPAHWQDAVLRRYLAGRNLQLIGEVRDPSYKTIRIYGITTR